MSVEKAEDGNKSLAAFFTALEKLLDHSYTNEWASFKIRVCGKIIELRFWTKESEQNAIQGLRGCIVRTQKTPDAIFKYWKADFSKYIGKERASSRWRVSDAAGCLFCSPWRALIGGDIRNKSFFYCHHPKDEGEPTAYAHLFHQLFYLWGKSQGMLLLHGAVVGAEGKGVLIAGRGGEGKSTLSVSCLLSGLEFVGDDYVFITEQGSLQAFPIYSSVCLNPDMFSLLNPDMAILRKRENGKLELDASTYAISGQLPVQGIIVPAAAGSSRPEIVSISMSTAITRAAHSSALQVQSVSSPELGRTIAARLMGLPAYELRQCRDVKKNAEFLRQFIIKEI